MWDHSWTGEEEMYLYVFVTHAGSVFHPFILTAVWITRNPVRKIQRGTGQLRWGCLLGCDVMFFPYPLITMQACKLSVGLDERHWSIHFFQMLRDILSLLLIHHLNSFLVLSWDVASIRWEELIPALINGLTSKGDVFEFKHCCCMFVFRH